MKRALVFVAAALVVPAVAHADDPPVKEAPSAVSPPPNNEYTYASPQIYPNAIWVLTQLIPSPEVGIGTVHKFDATGAETSETRTTFGLRWQLTPALWSWGTNRHVNRWRFFIVDPLARSAGSIAFDTKIDYFFGELQRFVVRPGVHATFPILQRGEYLSASIGTSVYQYDDTMRVSYDAGIYALYGILGLETNYAPTHAPLRYIATVRIRYF